MLAQALQGQIAALSTDNDESSLRRLLSMITNTIVSTRVATLEPTIPNMHVIYMGTKDENANEKNETKADE